MPRTYADNASNRRLGRAGMPMGSMVVSSRGSSGGGGSGGSGSGGGFWGSWFSSSSASSRSYADNASNRRLGRAGMPMGSMVVSSRGSSGGGGSGGSGSGGGFWGSWFSSSSASSRSYVDNSYNRSVGRVGMPVGSMVISKGSSSAGTGGGSYDNRSSGSSSSPASSSTKTYVDNAYNLAHGRVGLPVGSAVISKSGSSGNSASSTSSTKTYVDNPYNRRKGRVGLSVGSAVIHRTGPSKSDSTGNETKTPGQYGKPADSSSIWKVYVDNAMNRWLGRVGKPLGSMKVSKVSPTTKRIRDIEHGGDSFERPFPGGDDGGLGDFLDDFAMELALARLERDLQEQEWRQQTGHKKVRTTVKLLENYKGTKINFEDLKLGKKIGAGGFGDVHFAEWEGDVVAVKKLRVQRVSKRRLEEFTKEVLAFCDLQHPSIVGFIGACVTTPNLCIVMEYMQTSLYEALHIQNDVEFTEAERLEIIRGSCGGLEYLHDRSIAHCDLKSQNILLDYTAGETCVAKITDFGLSMMKANSESSTSAGEQVRNVGTPRYSAPEVLRGEMLSSKDMRQADVYSLGLIIFEVVFEEEPFYDLGYAQLKKQVGEKGLLPDMSEGREVTSSVRDTVETCLKFQPKHRPDVAMLKKTFGDMKSLYKFTNCGMKLGGIWEGSRLPHVFRDLVWLVTTYLFFLILFWEIYVTSQSDAMT